MTINNKQLALPSELLYHKCDLSYLKLTSTEDLVDSEDVIGQSRALEALNFGIGIRHDGYNLYVAGSTGMGKHTTVNNLLEPRAKSAETPSDWCYINNFDQPHKPLALELPAGHARQLHADMEQLVDDLTIAIPAAFESDEYQARAQEVHDKFKKREEQAFSDLADKAKDKDIVLLRTPGGYTLGPLKDGKILTPSEFDVLAKKEKDKIKAFTDEIEEELKSIIKKVPIWAKEGREKIKELNRELTEVTVEQFISELKDTYQDLPEVLKFLETVELGIITNVEEFRKYAGSDKKDPLADFDQVFLPFQVNVLVDNSDLEGAPIIYEDNPTYNNLMGRVEHLAQFGTLMTDFTLIKSGAMHRANGGYLVLDIRKVLASAFAWEGLKRALRAHEIKIQSLEQMLSLVSTISLEPEPIPIDLKVILTGERIFYYLLKKYDPEFNQLFKVMADFSEEMDRNEDNTAGYASLIATLQREQKLKAVSRGGMERIIEDCSRRIDDGEKLSLHMGNLVDLLCEANYWSTEENTKITTEIHVQKAIDSRIKRLDQLREQVHETVLRGDYLLQTSGKQVGQINGLSVIQLGDYAFGKPSRITATARLGTGKVIDIEREVDLGGSIHSKGVLILSSYLADRYAQDTPLSLSASLVFEQSYGFVEGDSASVAELCTLLSALSKLPLEQSMAITGSVNQLGQVQAIGGVNEKIEGFFDICHARGLTGEQGVIIPEANIKHLMLRTDVVEAVKTGRFNIYAVNHVDQVMELMTGIEAGEKDEKGEFPVESVNGLVQKRLTEMTEARRKFAKSDDEK
ncbi:MAG: AAA family ATPase [Gammaproteobacteria bacterium]|nr:AAA family ATPase [Gammaproteobacteria bacterium]